jgi:hypothetical protein
VIIKVNIRIEGAIVHTVPIEVQRSGLFKFNVKVHDETGASADVDAEDMVNVEIPLHVQWLKAKRPREAVREAERARRRCGGPPLCYDPFCRREDGHD